MFGYLARRMFHLLPTWLGVIVAVFLLARLAPGDPVRSRLAEKLTPEAYQQALQHGHIGDHVHPVLLAQRHNLGLDGA